MLSYIQPHSCLTLQKKQKDNFKCLFNTIVLCKLWLVFRMGSVQHPLLPTKPIYCLVGAEETQDRQGPYCMPLAGTCTAAL